MTPSSLLDEVLIHMRTNAVGVSTGKSRSRKNFLGRHIYNVFTFDYQGYQAAYMDIATDAGWDVKIHIRSNWGSLRVKAFFSSGVENAEWINTPPDRILLYKLARP